MSMTSFSACQGTTVDIVAAIHVQGGGAYDITNHTIVWVLSATRGGPALLTKSTTLGTITIISGPAGSLSFRITDAETNALPAAHYHHEIHLKSPAPNSKTYCGWNNGIAVIEKSSIGVI
jgi:hypothetical protein